MMINKQTEKLPLDRYPYMDNELKSMSPSGDYATKAELAALADVVDSNSTALNELTDVVDSNSTALEELDKVDVYYLPTLNSVKLILPNFNDEDYQSPNVTLAISGKTVQLRIRVTIVSTNPSIPTIGIIIDELKPLMTTSKLILTASDRILGYMAMYEEGNLAFTHTDSFTTPNNSLSTDFTYLTTMTTQDREDIAELLADYKIL